MSEKKNIQSTEEYINSVHRSGRIAVVAAIAAMLIMPFIAGVFFDALPSFIQVMSSSMGLLMVFVPIAISEDIAFAPVLGSSMYLTLITGNVMNLKIPVVNNALRILDVQYGSEEADVISNIAVSISSIVTVIIVALGVVLLIPLQPVFELPAVETAVQYVLPALFGSMALGVMGPNLGGGVKAVGRLKGAIAPVLIVLFVNLLDVFVLKTGRISEVNGILILIVLPVAYFGTRALYRKDKIQVILPEDSK